MKTLAVSLSHNFVGLGKTSAQSIINKTKSDYSTWTHKEGDPYNPATCGVLQFFIPGVAQMVAN